MTYVKMTGHSDPNNWVDTVAIDGTEVKKNVPVNLSAEKRKKLEARGYQFEDSSANEAREYRQEEAEEQPVGNDVVGTAPVFGDEPVKTGRK